MSVHTSPTAFVNIANAREEDQKRIMTDIIAAGHCPFCQEHLSLYHTQPILRQGSYWLLTKNQWPYAHTKVHLLAIYITHATQLHELAPESGQELIEHMQWAQKEYGVPGGAWAMRFGDTQYSAGTISHLHVQFIMPDLADPEYQPCKIKVGSRLE